VTNLDGGEAEKPNTSCVQHSAPGKSSHNTRVLPSSTLHYRTDSSQSETVLGTKPKTTKLHEDEAGASAEKLKKKFKAQKNKIVSLKLDFRSHKHRTKRC
jgi:GTP-dependent phosphoenolpyruvate carboxykinase